MVILSYRVLWSGAWRCVNIVRRRFELVGSQHATTHGVTIRFGESSDHFNKWRVCIETRWCCAFLAPGRSQCEPTIAAPCLVGELLGKLHQKGLPRFSDEFGFQPVGLLAQCRFRQLLPRFMLLRFVVLRLVLAPSIGTSTFENAGPAKHPGWPCAKHKALCPRDRRPAVRSGPPSPRPRRSGPNRRTALEMSDRKFAGTVARRFSDGRFSFDLRRRVGDYGV